MKQIITGALVLALSTGSTPAQNKTCTPENQNGHQSERVHAVAGLNLSADQKARLKSVSEDYRKQSAELKTQDPLTVAEMKARRKQLHQNYREQFLSVLTPEQKTKLEQMKKTGRWSIRAAEVITRLQRKEASSGAQS